MTQFRMSLFYKWGTSWDRGCSSHAEASAFASVTWGFPAEESRLPNEEPASSSGNVSDLARWYLIQLPAPEDEKHPSPISADCRRHFWTNFPSLRFPKRKHLPSNNSFSHWHFPFSPHAKLSTQHQKSSTLRIIPITAVVFECFLI